MLIRQTLNGRIARTVRDTGRDPYDYIEVAHRSPWLLRWWRPVSWLLFWATWAALGVLLAFRG
jgi:hypothetical protein